MAMGDETNGFFGGVVGRYTPDFTVLDYILLNVQVTTMVLILVTPSLVITMSKFHTSVFARQQSNRKILSKNQLQLYRVTKIID